MLAEGLESLVSGVAMPGRQFMVAFFTSKASSVFTLGFKTWYPT